MTFQKSQDVSGKEGLMSRELVSCAMLQYYSLHCFEPEIKKILVLLLVVVVDTYLIFVWFIWIQFKIFMWFLNLFSRGESDQICVVK